MITDAEFARVRAIRRNIKNATPEDKQWALDLFTREYSGTTDPRSVRILADAKKAGYTPTK